MKLLDELPTIYKAFEPHKTAIALYAKRLQAQGGYNDFQTRLCWDCLRTFIGTETICDWYGRYHANDKHITTAAKTVLKRLEII